MDLKCRKILVTGADGFIGSTLTERLYELGADVTALCQYNSFNSWGNLDYSYCAKNIRIVSGDIRDAAFCGSVTKGMDVVFNLAALIAIPYSYVAPASYIDTNVSGTLNICHAALHNDVGRVVQMSTSEVYGTAQYVPIDEKHPLSPQSPYSASKIGGDSIAMSFYNSFELPLVIARAFNTYGPRQSARAFIPTIITQMANGEKEIKLGDISPTRDLNYVDDTCDALIEVAKCDELVGETVNIGSNFEISVGDVFENIKKIMGSDAVIVKDPNRIRPAKSEVHRLWCDNSKLVKYTGFTPHYSIVTGLEKTVEWFKDESNLKRYKSDLYNI